MIRAEAAGILQREWRRAWRVRTTRHHALRYLQAMQQLSGLSQQEIRERLEPASWVQRTLERIVLKAKQRKIPDCTGKSVEILMQGFPLLGHRTRPPSQPIIWDIELTVRGLVQSLDEICHAVLLPQGFSQVPVAMIHRLASLWGLYSVKYRLFRVCTQESMIQTTEARLIQLYQEVHRLEDMQGLKGQTQGQIEECRTALHEVYALRSFDQRYAVHLQISPLSLQTPPHRYFSAESLVHDYCQAPASCIEGALRKLNKVHEEFERYPRQFEAAPEEAVTRYVRRDLLLRLKKELNAHPEPLFCAAEDALNYIRRYMMIIDTWKPSATQEVPGEERVTSLSGLQLAMELLERNLASHRGGQPRMVDASYETLAGLLQLAKSMMPDVLIHHIQKELEPFDGDVVRYEHFHFSKRAHHTNTTLWRAQMGAGGHLSAILGVLVSPYPKEEWPETLELDWTSMHNMSKSLRSTARLLVAYRLALLQLPDINLSFTRWRRRSQGVFALKEAQAWLQSLPLPLPQRQCLIALLRRGICAKDPMFTSAMDELVKDAHFAIQNLPRCKETAWGVFGARGQSFLMKVKHLADFNLRVHGALYRRLDAAAQLPTEAGAP